ncbi:MAG: hypothetical protein I3270_01710 [Candidatus Moeniiplasma glomeromycotorum]|nr:hypothetical protein [Candidatus Moeniiplasma glomeromycotorum]MCE8162423.1 hypothetical protein [Candidatus Moeniiplasma glomeromycotorum]MCE8166349.1 hypothetical protein [Candidatus Moeniiplasma glomeromycotorum]MCE8166831.1 hypothetical protein [Candidatus Moeniiplasma glomeromycotorum]
MTAKKPPSKPTNLSEYVCDVIIGEQRFTKLEISPDYEEKNQEFQLGLKRKRIKLTKITLSQVLIDDNLIQELVKQLDGKSKQEVKYEGSYYQYDYYTYEPLYNQWGYAFRLVWCIDKNNPHILGVIDCYWRDKYNKTTWPWY